MEIRVCGNDENTRPVLKSGWAFLPIAAAVAAGVEKGIKRASFSARYRRIVGTERV